MSGQARAIKFMFSASVLALCRLEARAASANANPLEAGIVKAQELARAFREKFRYNEKDDRCLAGGNEGWNESSRRQLLESNDGECADLHGWKAPLAYLKLKDANLRGINLADARFYGTRFFHSDLRGVKILRTFGDVWFYDCDLSGATLFDADLSAGTLGNSNLTGARFNQGTKLPISREEALRRGMRFIE